MFTRAHLVVIGLLLATPPVLRAGFLPGSVLNLDGTLAGDHGTINTTPESQPPTRPEFTTTDLSFGVQRGFLILLDQTLDPSIPRAGPPPGNGVTGIASAVELSRPQDWSDVAQFVSLSTTSGRVYWSSNPEGADKADTGTPLDTIAAHMGASNPGLAAPGPNDTVLFLLERNEGKSGDTGAGESNQDNKYLADNATYNLHSDPTLPGDDIVIPEPASLTLLSMGGAGLLGYGWLRRKFVAPSLK